MASLAPSEVLAALPAGYAELAQKMGPAVRSLVVHNADPSKVPVDDVLDDLGMPKVAPCPPSYSGLRSLSLLNMLPKPTGRATDILRVDEALRPEACAELRRAVNQASFSAADSVDGCTDYQLNLTRPELEALVGADAVDRLWSMAHGALQRFRSETMSHKDQVASTSQLLEAHEIFVRRYTPSTRPWFPFHKDRSELTINVALADDAAHGGGRLICLLDGAVQLEERVEGAATVHPSSLMHAVSRMTSGARFSLIIFFGRNERIAAFNHEVRRLLGGSRDGEMSDRTASHGGGSGNYGSDVQYVQHTQYR